MPPVRISPVCQPKWLRRLSAMALSRRASGISTPTAITEPGIA